MRLQRAESEASVAVSQEFFRAHLEPLLVKFALQRDVALVIENFEGDLLSLSFNGYRFPHRSDC
jgi:hypothetical protein